MHQIRFQLGICHRPHWESSPRTTRPDPLLDLRGPTSKGRGRRGKEKGEGEVEERGREREGGGCVMAVRDGCHWAKLVNSEMYLVYEWLEPFDSPCGLL